MPNQKTFFYTQKKGINEKRGIDFSYFFVF